MPEESTEIREREQRWGQVLVACLEALEKEPAPDRQGLLARYPEFAAELEEFFAQREQVGQAVSPLGTVVEEPGTIPRSFGDYELLEEIGQGGMGVVYKARQRSLNRLVALKRIRAGGLACRADVQRFRTEAESAASLDHPHIVPIYEVGELEGQPYFTMKLVTGRRLAEQLPGFLTDPRASARLLVEVAQAVHHAHQRGILHRDLKPSNILLDAEGRPHVTDFGLAKRLEADSSLTQSGLLVGTPSYMAPEQATGQRGAITTATDIYGLGAVLYVLLAGRPPFRGDSVLDTLEQVKQHEPEPPSACNLRVDRDLETICLKCLQKEPRDRYDSALTLAEDLEHWVAGEPIRARPISRRERIWRWRRRNPVVASLSAALLLLFVAGLAGVGWNYWRAEAALRELEASDYLHRISLAHRELTAAIAIPARAEELLEGCPPDRRGWEWHYLKRLWRVDPVILREPGNREVNSVAFSPDGIHLAAACVDHTGKVWHLKTGEVVTLRGHQKNVCSVAFNPTDGRRVASASADKTVRVWDLATQQELLQLHGYEAHFVGTAYSVTFSPDGRWLAAGSEGGTVRVWDGATGQQIHELCGHGMRASCVAFSPDGRLLASGNWDGKVRIWEAQKGRCLSTLGGHSHPVSGLAFSPNGRWLAAGYFDRLIDIWDTTTGELFRRLSGHTGLVLGLAFNPEGRLASASEDGTVRLWDLQTGQEILLLRGHTNFCKGLAFSLDGRLLASASKDGTIRIWDATPLTGTEGQERFTFREHTHEVWSVAISPDGTRIAAAGLDPTVRVWDARTGKVTQTFSKLAGVVFSLAFSPDSRRLAAAGFDDFVQRPCVLKVWDVQTGQVVYTHREPREIVATAFSPPDGRWLVLGLVDGTVNLVDTRTLREISFIEKHDGAVVIAGVTFRPDGQRLASAGHEGTVKVWDVTSAQASLEGWGAWLPLLGLWPQAHWSAPLSVAGVVQLQRASVRTLPSSGAPCWSVAFSPDGRRLVTRSGDGQLRLWEMETGQQIGTAGGHSSGQGSSVAFSPDGRWLASAAEDCTVKLCDAATLECKHTFRGHTGPIRSLAISRDGRRLVSGSQDRTVKVWKAPPLPESTGVADK